ncbi:FtsX-like permease family protein [Faecalicatena contorta]|uniref:Putative ABC transport system permease protein n=1 Tax=Faecalicatena contorta TaxID=39482 RepID=A0A316A0J2_9FIRM|nr:ABC transporter permease [Faecalicatena contorta]PWJ51059.1 putative ABC transport system permease protein [Faecalicatena contorta]SUQ13627.1 putative ABC transport system permease protein [Faecalicatena contorta]
MKLCLIVKNNIKSSRASSIVLVLLVVLSTLLMYTGITVKSQMEGFVDAKNEELSGADCTLLAGQPSMEKVLPILEQNKDISQYEIHDSIQYTSPKIRNQMREEKESNLMAIISNAEDTYNISRLSVIEEVSPIPDNGIIVPYILKVSNHYQTGDEMEIIVENQKYTFVVAGFYENVIFSSPSNLSMYQFFVYDSVFEKMRAEAGDASRQNLIHLNLNGIEGGEFEQSFMHEFRSGGSDANEYLVLFPYDTLKQGVTMFPQILMVVLIAFSLILLLIALVVIQFSVTVYLEKNIKNIGALEAVGYTAGQIKCAVLLEFLLLTAIGTLAGLILAAAVSAPVGNMISASIGLRWTGSISGLAILASILVNLLLIITVTNITAGRLKKITPLTALRDGIETHNFKKNYLPLEKVGLPLNLSIGMKGLLYNGKQNAVMTVIISLLTFACVYAIGMYYNFVINDTAMLNLVGIPTAELQMWVDAKDYGRVMDRIGKKEEVHKLLDYNAEEMLLKSDEKEVQVRIEVTKDFSKLDTDTLMSGRQAQYDNEIVISNRTMEELELKLGDSVTVSSFGEEAQYLIVGVKQHINHLGRGASLTEEGVKRLNADYKIPMSLIYLTEGTDVDTFIKELNREFSGVDTQIVNVGETLSAVMESFHGSIFAICVLCGGITVVTVVLILLLLIKVKLLKEQKQYGIYKALGYTSSQLIMQVGYSYLPVILLGSLLGLAAGILMSNPFTQMLLAGNGIRKVSLIIPYQYAILVPAGVILVSAVTIWLTSLKIQRIVPIRLFD